MQQTHLQPTAVAHIFSNLPKYVSKKVLPCSTTASTSSACQELENARIESCYKNLFASEEFDTFVIFKNKIASETLPTEYLTLSNSNNMQFHFIGHQKNFEDAPKLPSSVIVIEDLTIKLFVLSTPLPPSSFSRIMSGTKLSNTLKLINILTLCKFFSQTNNSNNSNILVNTAINFLEKYLNIQLDENTFDQNEQFLLQFILEQLRLIHVSKNGR